MQLPSDAEPPSSSSAGGRAGVLGDFSVFVGNLDPETAVADMEELLYELFLQVLILHLENLLTTHNLHCHMWACGYSLGPRGHCMATGYVI